MEQLKIKELPIVTKTLRLRIHMPFYGDKIENEILEIRKQKRIQKENELKNDNIRHSKKEINKILKEAEKLDKNFYVELKKQYPQIITWDELEAVFTGLQKKIAFFYNRLASQMYIESIVKNSKSGTRALYNKFYNKYVPEEFRETSVRQGLATKIKSNFRIKDLKEGKMSLPTIRSEIFPIPMWKQTTYDSDGFKSGFDVKEFNKNFVISLSVPRYKIEESKTKYGKYLECTFIGKKGKPKKIDIILSTIVRQRRKGWSRDEGTDAEIRKVMEGKYDVSWVEINRGKRFGDRNRWFIHFSISYVKSNFPCSNCENTFWTKRLWEKDNVDKKSLKRFKEELSKPEYYEFKNNKEVIFKGKKVKYDDFLKKKGKRILSCTNENCKFEIDEDNWLKKENEFRLQNKTTIGGIDVGVSRALVCAVNNSLNRYVIDGKKLIAHYNKGFARRRVLSKGNYPNRSGHGKENKFLPLTKLRGREENFRKKIIERWASEIARFFVKNNVGLVRMEDLSSMKNKSDDFFNIKLRGKWPYYQMQEKIRNKLTQNGVKVDFVTSENTSKICHSCGKINRYFDFKHRKENKFPLFECKECGKVKCPDDFNSAKNLARPDIKDILESYKRIKKNSKTDASVRLSADVLEN